MSLSKVSAGEEGCVVSVRVDHGQWVMGHGPDGSCWAVMRSVTKSSVIPLLRYRYRYFSSSHKAVVSQFKVVRFDMTPNNGSG